jgi:cell division septation protein DedD
MRRLTALAACLAVTALPLAGCGNKAPGLDKRDASELIRLLRKAQGASDDPARCNELLATISTLRAKVLALPSKVDSGVRESLSSGVDNLAQSARTNCQAAQTTPTQTTPTQTQTIPTTPPPTTAITPPPSTATTPPPSTSTAPPPTVPPVPTSPGTGGTGPGNGNGNGNGNGKRNQKHGKDKRK